MPTDRSIAIPGRGQQRIASSEQWAQKTEERSPAQCRAVTGPYRPKHRRESMTVWEYGHRLRGWASCPAAACPDLAGPCDGFPSHTHTCPHLQERRNRADSLIEREGFVSEVSDMSRGLTDAFGLLRATWASNCLSHWGVMICRRRGTRVALSAVATAASEWAS